jgi:hypothetical protein
VEVDVNVEVEGAAVLVLVGEKLTGMKPIWLPFCGRLDWRSEENMPDCAEAIVSALQQSQPRFGGVGPLPLSAARVFGPTMPSATSPLFA